MTNDLSLSTMAAGSGSIGQYGSSNPAVMAFLQATFALEGMGRLSNAAEAEMQSIGSAMQSSGISL